MILQVGKELNNGLLPFDSIASATVSIDMGFRWLNGISGNLEGNSWICLPCLDGAEFHLQMRAPAFSTNGAAPYRLSWEMPPRPSREVTRIRPHQSEQSFTGKIYQDSQEQIAPCSMKIPMNPCK